MKIVVALSFVSLLAFTPLHSGAQGTMLFQHMGANDPSTEGFVVNVGGGAIAGPVTNDLGLDAWSMRLPTGGDTTFYHRAFTAQEQNQLLEGWTISLNLRILELAATPNSGAYARIFTGAEQYALLFGLTAAGDPILRAGVTSLSPVYTLEGGGSTYHHYVLVYDGNSAAASLWVDGAQVITGITGDPNPTAARFDWGGNQHVGLAHANWNGVSFSIIPEPSSLLLLSLGGLVLAASHTRTRAKQ